MSLPCKLMIVEQAGTHVPLRERLPPEGAFEVNSIRVDCEAELRAVAREFAPDIVLGTDDLPTSPKAEATLLRLLSRHVPEVLVCEVGDGNAVRWEQRAGLRRAIALPASFSRPQAAAGSFVASNGLPSFFENSPDAVVIVDADGWIGFANASACALIGRYFPEPVASHLDTGPARGAALWEDAPRAPNVIPLRARRLRAVHGLVVFEASTRLATRVHLEDLVRAKTSHARMQARCLPLVALELNGLQQLGESHGQLACDELWGAISALVQPQYARCGLIASLGGGQQLVVLPHVSEAPDAAVAVQGRTTHTQEYSLTEVIPLCSETPANDPPMLRPSAPGRHVASAPDRASSVFGLSDAIRRRAISVHYQPQYDAETGEGCGVEALARWTLSNGETLMPGTFLPIAERIGVIGRLGAAVLDDACAMANTWRGRDSDRLTVAVNVSNSQISDEYTRALGATLKRSGFPARRLELEIDEEALIEAGAGTLERINQWRALGVRIAVNHRGSNYSSLAYLSRVRVDRLKLDRALVQRIPEQRAVAAFAHAVISLGREFNVDVMAQGVETTAQLHHLRDLGCHHVQGFLLARPMPAVQAQLALRRNFGNLPRAAAQTGAQAIAQAH